MTKKELLHGLAELTSAKGTMLEEECRQAIQEAFPQAGQREQNELWGILLGLEVIQSSCVDGCSYFRTNWIASGNAIGLLGLVTEI